MIKRQYVAACARFVSGVGLMSLNNHEITTKSWLPINAEDITNNVRNHVSKQFDCDPLEIFIVSISKL